MVSGPYIYENRWVRLVLVDVEAPDGGRFESHVARLGRVTIALLVDGSERVLTLWRYRFATDDWAMSLSAGLWRKARSLRLTRLGKRWRSQGGGRLGSRSI